RRRGLHWLEADPRGCASARRPFGLAIRDVLVASPLTISSVARARPSPFDVTLGTACPSSVDRLLAAALGGEVASSERLEAARCVAAQLATVVACRGRTKRRRRNLSAHRHRPPRVRPPIPLDRGFPPTRRSENPRASA